CRAPAAGLRAGADEERGRAACRSSGRRVTVAQFYNTSPLTMRRVLDDPNNVADNLLAYTRSFSSGARDVLKKFDLHPDAVSNLEMGYLYEELIRRFSELSNETAGEHVTPREVIRLMVNLLFIDDDPALSKPGVVKTLLDPACGTGGMLSVAEDPPRSLNPQARLEVYGQELNPETYAVCRSDMMLKGQDALAHRAGQLLLRRRCDCQR
ncbi:MAG: HsdM family class I SAM-dependent methyltransferase, partial [Geodermatophilaceae bacterium]